MDEIKASFEAEAKQFDTNIIQLIPYYKQMLEALTNAIPFKKSDPIHVLDLGCGTGTISKLISQLYPKSEITCIDIASNMIDLARHKLSEHKKTQFITGDFSNIQFDGKFDAIVSSLALHHLVTDRDKKVFYGKIYNILNNNGVFFNADVVLGSSDYLQELNIKMWKAFMTKYVSENEIENVWFPKYKSEDRPAQLIDQIKWLESIGFNSVDIIWKYYNFAVYGGRK